jgi:hypothetical protein
MKIITTLILTAAVACSAFAQDSGKASVLGDKLGQAFASGDISKVNDLISDKATIYWIHKKFYNLATFDKYLKAQFTSSPKHLLSLNPDSGFEDDNISTSWGSFMFMYNTMNGVSNSLPGRYTVIATKVGEKWQIVSLHLSLPYPPNAPNDDTVIGN